MNYREDVVYMALEKIIKNAGVKIIYGEVHNDPIDGAIWARSDFDGKMILMPEDGEAFPDANTACKILGHEMGHLMTGLESVDGEPALREINESTCDFIGALLFKLADMTDEHEVEELFKQGLKRVIE